MDKHLYSLQSEQLCQLRSQCNELTTKLSAVTQGLQQLQEEKTRVDKTNEILLESVRVAQTQKDIYCEEQEKIQNLQQIEIDKLKNLLSFREQESVDRMGHMRQQSQQIESLSEELERLRPMESVAEDLRDELEQLRHSSQQEKNLLTTTLAAALLIFCDAELFCRTCIRAKRQGNHLNRLTQK